MSDKHGEAWSERCQESLDNDPMHYITKHSNSMADFLCHIEDALHPDQWQELVNSWLVTDEGKKWYAETLDQLVRDCPENEDDPRSDR